MYDIIYIGGGLNYAGAVIAAKNGLKVALIEKDLKQLGGVCLHKGCIPSKMFLHYADTAYKSRNEIFEGRAELNMQALVGKKTELIKSSTEAVTSQCSQLELIEGEGVIKEPYQVSVNERVYEARHIVIGTGSSPFIPEGIVHDAKRIVTSDEVLELRDLPKEICIYGAGAIGLEMASFFAASGAKVTLISHTSGLQKRAHPLIQKGLKKQLEKMQISFVENQKIVKAEASAKGVEINFENREKMLTSMLLVASGRIPNTSVISTEKIEVEKGIKTDDNFETTLKEHYAIGDCNGKLQLAHAARAEVLNVTERILGKDIKRVNLEHVVKFIHTLPMSYASIGKNRQLLDQARIPYKESVVNLNSFTLSFFHHADEGKMVVYADEEGFILGAEILAPDAEELISAIAMALAGEMDVDLAGQTIMAHPTFSEALERTFFRL